MTIAPTRPPRHGLTLVSEIQPIKHPLQKGIKAQRGIEL